MKRFFLSLIICTFALFHTSCEELNQALSAVSGCMLPDAPNFNADALLPCTTECVGSETGSNCCCEEIVYGCTDTSSPNYSSVANAACQDASCGGTENCCCITSVSGCMDSSANNYDPLANVACTDCCEY